MDAPFPQPLSPTFPDTGPGPPARRDPPRGPAAWGKVGGAFARSRSLLLLLPAIPRARGRRLRHACLQAREPSRAARPGRPSPTRRPGARRGSLLSPSSPGGRRAGLRPAAAASSLQQPGPPPLPRARSSSTRGAAGGAGGERRAERQGVDGRGKSRAAWETAGSRGGRRTPRAPRPAPRTLAASGDARAATGHTSGSPCPGGESRPPRQRGQRRGRRERGGGRGQAAGRLPPRGRASWLRLGARRPAASRLRGEFGWSGRRDRGGAGSPGARESGADEEDVEEGAGRRQPGLQLGASPPQEPRRRGGAAVQSRRELLRPKPGSAAERGCPGRWRRAAGIGSEGPGDPLQRPKGDRLGLVSGAAAELGSEVHLGQAREAGFDLPSGGKKEGEGASALGMGTPDRRPGRRPGLWEPLGSARCLVPGSRDSPEPWEPPATARSGE